MTQILVCGNQVIYDWLYDFFNLSDHLHDNIRRMAQVDWIKSGSIKLSDGIKLVDVELSPILTKRGIGFTFNLFEAQKLLNLAE